MYKIGLLIVLCVFLLGCSRKPTEIRVVVTEGKKGSVKILSFSENSIISKTSSKGSSSNGAIFLGDSVIKNYSFSYKVYRQAMYFLMQGIYTADIKLLIDGKVCASGVFKSGEPFKQVRLECSIR
jgi:hypothetical protein